ncbi:MAG: ABC transporter permease [Betaproteobacteria bacterium]|nr:MAG: ABC transporter permease [Betaproteobacteria bacterium]
MMLLGLAWRNVLRNRRRTAITVSSIAIGLAAMTFLWGFIDGMNRQMIVNTTRFFAGDVQVHLKGYHDDPTLDLTIPESGAVLRAVRGDPAVAAASVRMEGKALASRGDKSRGVVVAGVAPQEEAKVTVLFEAVVEGGPLRADETGILLGEKLAEALGIHAGEELVLVGQAYDGSVASGRYPVRGVFRTKIDELDGYLAVMSLDAVREFFAAPGGATAIALRLRDRSEIAPVRARLATSMGERYEVLGWPTLLPMVAVSVRFHEVVTYVVLLMFLVVVAAAVANPVLMAVLERTREFGIMLAVGTSRGRLLRLVLQEAVLLGLAGLAAGNALGLGLTAYFGRAGIDLGAFEAGLRTMPGLSDFIYPVVRADRSLILSAIVLATACIAALYPAVNAARLEPVEAIRGRARARASAGHGAAASTRWPVFVLIAARNILRNRRRTAIMVGGAAFSVLAFVFVFGFFDGFFDGMVENSTRYLTGHVQLERAGFRKDLAPELALDKPAELLTRLRSVPNVAAAAPRVQAQALASSATKSEGIVLIGIDPLPERSVTFIHRTIVQGKALDPGADREIVIGRKLAERLRVRLGEKVVVMAQAADGELGTAAYRVSGIFATESSTFDSAIAYVTLPAAQSLLALGARVSTVNIRLGDRAALERTMEDLRRLAAAPGLVLAPWQELLPQLDEMVRFNRVVSDIILAVFLLVVATAIMNTVFMAVAERTREFGVLMALGTPPGAIRRMVVYETIVLMTLASLLGYGIGIALVEYFGRQGIDLSGFFQGYAAIPGLTGIVYPKVLVATTIPPGVALLIASVLVSLYPAAKAARLDPVAAIRHA